jgi:hypothetical protein
MVLLKVHCSSFWLKWTSAQKMRKLTFKTELLVSRRNTGAEKGVWKCVDGIWAEIVLSVVLYRCVIWSFVPERNFLYNNALISQIYFGKETLHVSDISSVHRQELFTVHSAMVYVIEVCGQRLGRIRLEFHPDPARKLSTDLYDIYHCWVYSE